MKALSCIALLISLLLTLFSCDSSPCSLQTNLIPVKVDSLYGYIDNTGTFQINNKFTFADYFIDGIALVVVDAKVGYIDQNGNYVVAPQYQSGTPFYNGRAVVVTKGSWPIIIDKKGETIYDLREYDNVYFVTPDLLCGSNESGRHLLTLEGNTVYSTDSYFFEGIDIWYPSNQNTIRFYESDEFGNKSYGLMDNTGSIIVQPQYQFIGNFSENGLASFKREDNKWGYINAKGDIIITPRFDFCGKFFNEIATVQIEDKYGYINEAGEYIIQPKYDETSYFVNGFAWVKIEDSWKLIDMQGSIKGSAIYKYITRINAELSFANNADGKKFIIHNDGTELSTKPVEADWRELEILIYENVNNSFFDVNGFSLSCLKEVQKFGVENIGKILTKENHKALKSMGFYIGSNLTLDDTTRQHFYRGAQIIGRQIGSNDGLYYSTPNYTYRSTYYGGMIRTVTGYNTNINLNAKISLIVFTFQIPDNQRIEVSKVFASLYKACKAKWTLQQEINNNSFIVRDRNTYIECGLDLSNRLITMKVHI